MNEIIQKRIEEAARNYADSLALPEWDKRSIHAIDFKKGAVAALHNQWISVEEALPPKEEEDYDTSITVLVRCRKGWKGIDYYRFKYEEWCNNRNDVTHWMLIPQLKGGEE